MESIRIKVALCLGITLILVILRSLRKGDVIDGNDFLDISLTTASVVLAISLILRLFQEEVVNILKEDTISLLMGAGSQIVVSMNQQLKSDIIFAYNPIKSLATKIVRRSNRRNPKGNP